LFLAQLNAASLQKCGSGRIAPRVPRLSIFCDIAQGLYANVGRVPQIRSGLFHPIHLALNILQFDPSLSSVTDSFIKQTTNTRKKTQALFISAVHRGYWLDSQPGRFTPAEKQFVPTGQEIGRKSEQVWKLKKNKFVPLPRSKIVFWYI